MYACAGLLWRCEPAESEVTANSSERAMESSVEDGGFGRLSHRAEVFRSKLIEDFQILDRVTEEGRDKAPVYNSSDVTSTAFFHGLIKTNSCSLIF